MQKTMAKKHTKTSPPRPRPSHVALVEVDGWATSRAESRGHAERPAPGTEYTSFDMADLDIKVVLALTRKDPHLAALVHVPEARMCAYFGSPRLRFSPRRCQLHFGGMPRIANVPGGLALTSSQPRDRASMCRPGYCGRWSDAAGGSWCSTWVCTMAASAVSATPTHSSSIRTHV